METINLKKALILRDVKYRFGKRLSKGEVVNIKKDITQPTPTYTAFRPGNEVLGFGIMEKFFHFTDERKLFVLGFSLEGKEKKGIITKHKSEIEAINAAIEGNAKGAGFIYGTAREDEAIAYCKEHKMDFFAMFL